MFNRFPGKEEKVADRPDSADHDKCERRRRLEAYQEAMRLKKQDPLDMEWEELWHYEKTKVCKFD